MKPIKTLSAKEFTGTTDTLMKSITCNYPDIMIGKHKKSGDETQNLKSKLFYLNHYASWYFLNWLYLGKSNSLDSNLKGKVYTIHLLRYDMYNRLGIIQ